MKIFFVDGEPVLWLGSEASFDLVIQAQTRALEYEAKNGQFDVRSQSYDGADGLPAMIEKRGNVGILNISGSLINGAAGYMRYFGVVGYADIAAAAHRIYADPDVERVLVRVESPGGMVDGIMDAGETLTRLSKLKTSMSYSGSQAASGGYWLATSISGPFHAGPTASIGSIGVVSVHTDVTAMLEKEGIKKTVLRSGENKMRINAFEPLTPELKAKEEAKMADVHGIFRAQVAKARPNLGTEDLLAVTDGSTFLGKRAKAAGLIDGVHSFEQALKLLDSQIPSSNTPHKSKGASMKLTEQHIAMLLNGAPVSALGLSAEDQAACQAQIDTIVNMAKATGDDLKGDKKPEVITNPPTAPPAGDVTAVTEQLTAATAQVTDLTAQLAKVTADLAEANTKVAAAEPLQAQVTSLLNIARGATGKLQVALGVANTAATLDVAAVVAEHARLDADFLTKFKPGPVSKVTTEVKDQPAADPAADFLKQRMAMRAQAAKA